MFFNKKKKNNNSDFVKVCALLIHAAKIDENYSHKEEEIIEKTLLGLGVNKNDLEKIITKAKKIEEDANQILDFTREIKNLESRLSRKIQESLDNPLAN